MYNEIKDYITKNKAFGTVARTIDDYTINCSAGVRMLLDRLPEAEQGIMESIDNFLHCDFGDFYEWQKNPQENIRTVMHTDATKLTDLMNTFISITNRHLVLN